MPHLWLSTWLRGRAQSTQGFMPEHQTRQECPVAWVTTLSILRWHYVCRAHLFLLQVCSGVSVPTELEPAQMEVRGTADPDLFTL